MSVTAKVSFFTLFNTVMASGVAANLNPLCNGDKTVHCIRSPNSAQLVGSPFVHLDSGSFLGQEVDAVGVHTWAVSNTAAVRLTFRCGNSGHSQTFNMGLTPTGGVLFGPQVEGSASVYFNDNPGQKATCGKEIQSSTPGVDVTGSC